MKKIKIKYHDADMELLQKISQGDWIDLRAAETVELKRGEFKLISLGVSMKFPDGYEGHVVPRSSTYKNFKVIQANSMGVIDNSYSGDDDVWMFPAIALEDTKIEKGDRICQFRMVKSMTKVRLDEVNYLDDQPRGGFGSTGVK